jgi:hypothetical protein
MSSTLENALASLQQAVKAALHAGENQNLSQNLLFLKNSLALLDSTARVAKEIETLVRDVLVPGSTETVDTSPIDDLVAEMWTRYVNDDYRNPPDGKANSTSDQVRRRALELGNQSWRTFLDTTLNGLDLDINIPQGEMLHMINPALKVPNSFSYTQQKLQQLSKTPFETRWEACAGTKDSFLETTVDELMTGITDFRRTLEPIIGALSALPPTVRSTLESALSSEGVALSSLDLPEVSAWMAQNPGAKNMLVIRFKKSD